MDPIVMRAGQALVGAMAGDAWPQVREAVVGFWPNGSKPPQAGGVDVDAELDELREQILHARAASDKDTERALEGAWQIKLQQLLSANPALGRDLSRVTNQILIPALLLEQAESDPGGSQDADGNGMGVSTAVIGQAASDPGGSQDADGNGIGVSTAVIGQAASDPGGSQDADGNGMGVSTAVIGQAAAGLTAIAAIIYGAGALTIALQLFFTHLSWEAVLGQLPHDVILTTGFGQIVLPSIIIGMLGAVLLNFFVNDEHGRLGKQIQLMLQRYLTAEPSIGHFLVWLFTAAFFGALEAIISLPFYISHAHTYFNTGVVIPAFDAMLVSAILSALAVSVALIMLPHPTAEGLLPDLYTRGDSCIKKLLKGTRDGLVKWTRDRLVKWKRVDQFVRWTRVGRLLRWAYPERPPRKPPKPSSLKTMGWMIRAGALIAFAAIPGIATFSAVTLFPASKACSTQFLKGRLEGNLIATNGGWAYMVEYENTSPVQDFIAVVPLSSLQMETIGHAGSCGNLVSNPVNSPSPTPSPSRQPTPSPSRAVTPTP